MLLRFPCPSGTGTPDKNFTVDALQKDSTTPLARLAAVHNGRENWGLDEVP